jgi:hypothetical protein
VARTAALLVYAAALVLLRPQQDAALAFARLYCAAQVLYLALMAAAALRKVRPA